MSIIKNYTELSKLETFEERYRYLKLEGKVGEETFGWSRILNQLLYSDSKWKSVRREVIIRDNACDLGDELHRIPDGVKIIVHHMNPITLKQVEDKDPMIYDPEYLITTIHPTHNAIHYGDESQLDTGLVLRSPNDTVPWR